MFNVGDILTEENYTQGAIWCNENGYTIKEIESTEKEITETETYFEDEEVEVIVQEAQDAVQDDEGNIIVEAVEEVREKYLQPVEKTREVTKIVTVRQYQIVEKSQPTEQELKQARINELKAKLANTDYVVIKIAEGDATTEEYAEVLANRKAWRVEINELEVQD